MKYIKYLSKIKIFILVNSLPKIFLNVPSLHLPVKLFLFIFYSSNLNHGVKFHDGGRPIYLFISFVY